MADETRKPLLDRIAALAVVPFLLGRRALNFEWIQSEGRPSEPQPGALARIAVNSPEHAIKRRG